MFITIDAEKCMGHGRCYAVAPTLLDDDEEGFVEQRGQTWEIAQGLENEAQEAMDACPESAIRLMQDPS